MILNPLLILRPLLHVGNPSLLGGSRSGRWTWNLEPSGSRPLWIPGTVTGAERRLRTCGDQVPSPRGRAPCAPVTIPGIARIPPALDGPPDRRRLGHCVRLLLPLSHRGGDGTLGVRGGRTCPPPDDSSGGHRRPLRDVERHTDVGGRAPRFFLNLFISLRTFLIIYLITVKIVLRF